MEAAGRSVCSQFLAGRVTGNLALWGESGTVVCVLELLSSPHCTFHLHIPSAVQFIRYMLADHVFWLVELIGEADCGSNVRCEWPEGFSMVRYLGREKNRTLLADLWIAADKSTDFFTWLRFEFLSGFRGQRLKPWKHINTPQGNKILSNPQHFLLRIISSPLPPLLSLYYTHTDPIPVHVHVTAQQVHCYFCTRHQGSLSESVTIIDCHFKAKWNVSRAWGGIFPLNIHQELCYHP